MRESVEFRIPEKLAQTYLEPSAGTTLGGIARKVVVDTTDRLYKRMLDVDNELRKNSGGETSFYSGWFTLRTYTKSELSSARAFQLMIKHIFEPTGEECGTLYDESTACSCCGSGATQTTELILEGRSLPRSGKLAVAKSIGGEIVIARELKEVFEEAGLRGAVLRPIGHRSNPSKVLEGWRQLFSTSARVRVVDPTKAGVSPSDLDAQGQYRCPCGSTIGLNLLSELSISEEDFITSNCDVVFTKQTVGDRRGLLRPEPLLVVSPRARLAMIESGLKGFRFEVVHLK